MSSVPEKEGLRATFHFVRWAHVHKGQWKIGLKKYCILKYSLGLIILLTLLRFYARSILLYKLIGILI